MSVDRYTQLCNHYHNRGKGPFHRPQILSYPFVENPHLTDPLSIFFFLFPKFYVNRIIEHVACESGFFHLHNAFFFFTNIKATLI